MNFRNKLYIFLAVTAGAILVLCFMIILPLSRSILTESKILEQERKKFASTELLAQNFENFEKNYQFYAAGLEEMNMLLTTEAFIDPELPIDFINFFKQQAEELNLSLKILPAPIENDDQDNDVPQKVIFRIEWVGNFLNTMRFVEKLENSRWLTEVISVSLSKYSPVGREQVPQENGLVQANISIRVYAKK
jgi:hypothetical protein